ncbi:hypothetical protein TVAG_102980 [Trichomonas vaginalis G3]|uniref:60S ribosomal protein L6 n=1 Tax=Trichomonas vaginalis (strain ATCC PRA-98 / G3) TaxID=412133 RepID=A2GP87_TRIV3|nr:ribosomal large subunit assembly [Trichomonas vaginalis G3]EAX81030.1 hypothetical protein TVAG_102980 [Trichomonas vaginalis G3]KAI5501502.1 ribosomal large subunit assembly [Trichomonas vaginalis G3]|eukprot:XP_001293960.1 hypothetical protein [Trichomonas vaginalis G3]
MTEILFIHPIEKKDKKKPTWRGIPRISFTRPAIATQVEKPTKQDRQPPVVETRPSFQIGTIVIVVGGENQGKRAVVVDLKGNGIIKIAGPHVPVNEISQDYLIATSTKLDIAKNSTEGQILAAAMKTPHMVEYLKAPFKIKKGDRVHLWKF